MASSIVMMGSLLMTPVVPGRPFMAVYEKRVAISGSSEDVERGTIAVDGQGRARTAIEVPGGQSVAAVYDPLKRAAWIVDSASNQLLMNIPWPEESSQTAPISSPATQVRVPSTSQPLGARTIDGLVCDGTRTIIEAPEGHQTFERWVSRDLGHVVLEVRASDSEKVTFRMFEIKRQEPDPKLFQPVR